MDETKEINMNQIVNLEQAGFYKATARAYMLLSKGHNDFEAKMYYLGKARHQLELAMELLK